MPGLINWKRRAEGVHFEGDVFEKLDLRSMKAGGSTWKDCTFRECKFDLSDWRASKFEDCAFEGCSMRLVNFAVGSFEGTRFINCDLEQTSFMGARFVDVSFGRCRMAYGETMFQDATVKQELTFIGCNLHGSNMDFREVEPKALHFDDCNLWGIKLGMACEFWNCTLSTRSVRQFLALIARVADDPRIAELAGDQYAPVCRAIDGRAAPCTPVSTTSPVTTSTQTRSSPAQTATMAQTMTAILTSSE